ncbi:hypothetical protein [Ancylobacter radicis]|uniref:Uncharacterized protein n=1 Tax=Ancylobacter radicis TaxID=2836179 RepID=A0ABS5R7A3_9HYPH|nr:hypothetical protein [Ancylobacter radicis]MBS9476262.1 hypothetical protein [Ancylobacter radicis]
MDKEPTAAELFARLEHQLRYQSERMGSEPDGDVRRAAIQDVADAIYAVLNPPREMSVYGNVFVNDGKGVFFDTAEMLKRHEPPSGE